MDGATVAGLTLAVIPLMISALENYEYTLQPFIIFSRRYQREAAKVQDSLKILRTDFANECRALLAMVVTDQDMVRQLKHPMWRDGNIEVQLKSWLGDLYYTCTLALNSINEILTDIIEETKTLEILAQKKRGGVNLEWIKRLRQRSKISFSKDRFNAKLQDLEREIGRLHRLREHIRENSGISGDLASRPSCDVTYFHSIQFASSRLYESLSTLWRCERTEHHTADISLEDDREDSARGMQRSLFTLSWACPSWARPPESQVHAVQLCVEAFRQPARGIPQYSQRSELGYQLQEKLTLSLKSAHSEGIMPNPGHLDSVQPPELADVDSTSNLNLNRIPDLCYHLKQSRSAIGSTEYVGFLQKSKTFKHVIYGKEQLPKTMTLHQALVNAKRTSTAIALPEKLRYAKLLAGAVLRLHSTPWMNQSWQSTDIILYRDDSPKGMQAPYLKARVVTQPEGPPRQLLGAPRANFDASVEPVRTPIRNRMLFNLGVMLIELAHNSPLQDLQISQDDQGDPHTLYWTAIRLGNELWRYLSAPYYEAVKVCLYGPLGASSDLEDPRVESAFIEDVLQKLELLAKL